MERTELTTSDLRTVKRVQSVRVFLLAVVLVASGVVIADNTRVVHARWLFDGARVHMYWALAVAWGAGLIAGLLAAWPAGRRIMHRAELIERERAVASGTVADPAAPPAPPEPPARDRDTVALTS